MAMKIKTYIKKLNSKNAHQLSQYAFHNMGLHRAELIDALEYAGEKVDKKMSCEKLCEIHREAIIDIIIELIENCD